MQISDPKQEYDILVCKCANPEHQVVITTDEEEVYLTIHLKPMYGFRKRFWAAIKYVCGYKSSFGHFDDIILRNADADKLQKVVDKLKSLS